MPPLPTLYIACYLTETSLESLSAAHMPQPSFVACNMTENSALESLSAAQMPQPSLCSMNYDRELRPGGIVSCPSSVRIIGTTNWSVCKSRPPAPLPINYYKLIKIDYTFNVLLPGNNVLDNKRMVYLKNFTQSWEYKISTINLKVNYPFRDQSYWGLTCEDKELPL